MGTCACAQRNSQTCCCHTDPDRALRRAYREQSQRLADERERQAARSSAKTKKKGRWW